MLELPGGEFWMGSPENESERYDDETRHRVRVSPFAMAKYLVTQKLYQEVMEQSPSYFKGESLPVERVSWFDAVRFCNKLSERVGLQPCYRIVEPKQGKDKPADEEAQAEAQPEVEWDQTADGYRLPTEAEWEYACRAGTATAYSFGDDAAQLGEYAWFKGNSENRTHEVGTKKPNGWGLSDLLGNVWEWCWDWYAEYPVTSDNDKSVSLVCPVGPPSGDWRVLRGGSFGGEPWSLRSANRNRREPTDQVRGRGFRCVRGSARQP
jgi:formylglycine-generating enzyme required for sulfatase activity